MEEKETERGSLSEERRGTTFCCRSFLRSSTLRRHPFYGERKRRATAYRVRAAEEGPCGSVKIMAVTNVRRIDFPPSRTASC